MCRRNAARSKMSCFFSNGVCTVGLSNEMYVTGEERVRDASEDEVIRFFSDGATTEVTGKGV
mgnify:CR=1 FL=1